MRRFGMAAKARRLQDDVAVPLQLEPGESVDDGLDRLGCGTLAIGILDAQQELPAVMLGEEPVEERRARSSDMKKAGGRGGEADDGGHLRRSLAQMAEGVTGGLLPVAPMSWAAPPCPILTGPGRVPLLKRESPQDLRRAVHRSGRSERHGSGRCGPRAPHARSRPLAPRQFPRRTRALAVMDSGPGRA